MSLEIKDVAYYLPRSKVTNDDINVLNPEWEMDKVLSTSGVEERYKASEQETALDLAYEACLKIFSKNPVLKNKVDALVFCTQSPDYIMPPNSCLLQAKLGLGDKVFAFDYNLACSGFTYGLAICNGLICSGVVENVLLVNADTYSKYIHQDDRSCGVLFGDGASVTWLSKADGVGQIMDFTYGTYGQLGEHFIIQAGGARLPLSEETKVMVPNRRGKLCSLEHIQMNGLGILTFVQDRVRKHIQSTLEKNRLRPEDLDLVIFHQASRKALDVLTKRCKFPKDKVYDNIRTRGNTVSASIPICIRDAWDEGLLKPGHKVLMTGFGVGLSYSSCVVQF